MLAGFLQSLMASRSNISSILWVIHDEDFSILFLRRFGDSCLGIIWLFLEHLLMSSSKIGGITSTCMSAVLVLHGAVKSAISADVIQSYGWLFRMLTSFWVAFYQHRETCIRMTLQSLEDGDSDATLVEDVKGTMESKCGEVIESGDEIEFSEELKELLPDEAGT
ncbi:putative ribonuclease H-like domain-containing protein [Tanacetum coccineum]|uniref:Ribonuclease H-like domain-containing protein n=1 Tax=Tanacetum coccineum TaxID=301880 RepID=A0ABQ4YCG1_9ASTR